MAALMILANVGSASIKGSCGGGGSGYSGFSGYSGYSGPGCTADLAVRIFESQDPITVGHRMFYLIQITNNGPDFAEDVSFEASVPSGVHFDWATASPFGFCSPVFPGGTKAQCEFFMDSGSTSAVILEVRPQAAGTIKESVRVTSSSALDPDTTNNSARAKTTITS